MTPGEFYRLYRNMSVDLISGVRLYGIDVHEYRNAADYDWEHGGNQGDAIDSDHEVDAGMDVAYAALRKAIRKHGKRIGTGRYRIDFLAENGFQCIPVTEYVALTEMLACYDGKGSPQAIRQALRLAAAGSSAITSSRKEAPPMGQERRLRNLRLLPRVAAASKMSPIGTSSAGRIPTMWRSSTGSPVPTATGRPARGWSAGWSNRVDRTRSRATSRTRSSRSAVPGPGWASSTQSEHTHKVYIAKLL